FAGDDDVALRQATAGHLGAAAVAGADPHHRRLRLAIHQPVEGGATCIDQCGQCSVPARLAWIVQAGAELGEILLHARGHALAHLRFDVGVATTRRSPARRPEAATATSTALRATGATRVLALAHLRFDVGVATTRRSPARRPEAATATSTALRATGATRVLALAQRGQGLLEAGLLLGAGLKLGHRARQVVGQALAGTARAAA